MKISSISGIYNAKPFAFKGTIVQDSARAYYGYPTTHLNAALQTGRRYEKTLGSYHTDQKYKIYYADPLEKVSETIKDNVDYVFYDDEPIFPSIEKEVSKRYFFERQPFQTDYADMMDKYRAYFYRMEMSDSKQAQHYENLLKSDINVEDSKEKLDYFRARISDAKYNQETAANCVNIHREALEKIYKKDEIYDRIDYFTKCIEAREKDIPMVDHELKQRTQLDNILKTKIDNLNIRKTAYEKIKTASTKDIEESKKAANFAENAIKYNKEHSNYGNLLICSDVLNADSYTEEYKTAGSYLERDIPANVKENEIIDKNLKSILENIEKYTKLKNENKIILDNFADYKLKIPKILNKYRKELAENEIAYEKIKGELIPYFDKLKNYFNSRGLKMVKY